MSPPSIGSAADVAYGHVVAARGRGHIQLVSPTIKRPLRLGSSDCRYIAGGFIKKHFEVSSRDSVLLSQLTEN